LEQQRGVAEGTGAGKDRGRPAPPNGYSRRLRYPAALLTLGAAAIHLSVAPNHLQEYLLFGVLFLLTGALQVVLALAIVFRPSRRLLAVTGLVAAGCLAVWTTSRTIGLPLGAESGAPEAVGVPDVITDLFESVSLLLVAVLFLRGPRPQPGGRGRVRGVVFTATPITLLTAIGFSAGINPLPYAVNMGVMNMAGMNMAATGQPVIPMGALTEPAGTQPLKSFTLTAQTAQVDGRQAYSYNGAVPGPELRVNQGDRVRVTLINHLPESTTIHWHGLRLPNAEDGVSGVTQDAIAPGATYTYEFVVKDPGTYWYHAHQHAEQQISSGLYGALVVEPPATTGAVRYDHDYAAIVGDANENQPPLHLAATPGQLVRLRLISAFGSDMTGTPELLALIGAPYKVIALDGHDLNQPQRLGPELLPIGTGQRYDLAFQMPAGGQITLLDERPKTGTRVPRTEWLSLGDGAVPPVANAASLPGFDLTTYGVAAPDPVASRPTFDVSQDLRIGNQLGFRYGERQFIHTLNGRSSPDTTPIIVREGQYVRLRFINNTDEYHPMHLHGHFFSVLSKNGKPISGSPVHLDSVLVGPHETWVVGFLADNPGLWMLHCHVLVHAAFGLSTMVNYVGVTTPYTIGTKSGNFPD
ncbi:MAG TPA: multicopper oxidase family protein, partial [Chloroflexota bacterium]|nr:multicopper oxidase family protein [Chloroflexota bacterium]